MKRSKNELFYIWITAVCFSCILLIVSVLIFVVVSRSLGYFWIPSIKEYHLQDGRKFLGTIQKREKNAEAKERIQLKIANRDFYNFDFKWIDKADIIRIEKARNAYILERKEYGDFYGGFASLTEEEQLRNNFRVVQKLLKQRKKLERRINKLNYRISKKELKIKKQEYYDLGNSKLAEKLRREKLHLEKNFGIIKAEHNKFNEKLSVFQITLKEIEGREKKLPIENILKFYQPNQMGFWSKIDAYFRGVWEFLSGYPREANTEGGVFPIIFGTVMLVFIMSIFCYPFGLAAAIYLSEYAKDNWLTYLIRIAVNNLAGVPSIVYGIFGLSFFIYGIGSFLDQVFFPERLPTPTFGTGGILWASLTLSILTLPIVIVATEEALNAGP